MSWLKRIGQVVLKIIGISSGFLPLVGAVGGATGAVVQDKLTLAFNAIVTAEQMYAASEGPEAKTGAQKLKAATPFVAKLVEDVLKELPATKAPKDSKLFEDAVTRMTAAMADVLNSVGV